MTGHAPPSFGRTENQWRNDTSSFLYCRQAALSPKLGVRLNGAGLRAPGRELDAVCRHLQARSFWAEVLAGSFAVGSDTPLCRPYCVPSHAIMGWVRGEWRMRHRGICVQSRIVPPRSAFNWPERLTLKDLPSNTGSKSALQNLLLGQKMNITNRAGQKVASETIADLSRRQDRYGNGGRTQGRRRALASSSRADRRGLDLPV